MEAPLTPSLARLTDGLRRQLIALAWVYYTFLFGWLAAYLLVGDRWGAMGLVNALSLWYFAPLLPVLALAPWLRRRSVWAGLLAGGLAFCWLWGGLLWPRPAPGAAPTLKVMTYNVLGMHTNVDPVLDVLHTVDADVVFLQEVNEPLAAALRTRSNDRYPYMVLDPENSVRGMGVLSKFPLHPAGETLPLEWVGAPQILTLDWHGQAVTVVNFHMWATGLAPPAYLEENFRQRALQAEALVALARRTPGPLIAAGDANSAPVSDAYRILTSALTDAWPGHGFGHTFPGSTVPGSSRPQVAGVPVPQWLVRIDYVFFSGGLEVGGASLAPFDGVSDHRGVVVEFVIP